MPAWQLYGWLSIFSRLRQCVEADRAISVLFFENRHRGQDAVQAVHDPAFVASRFNPLEIYLFLD
jgi:hypothetical protein